MIKENNNFIVPNGLSVPSDTRLYVIGDIHGRADLLNMMITEVNQEIELGDPLMDYVVVFLGDYVDRGAKSREVIDTLLMTPFRMAQTIYLRGNHEQVMLDFLEGKTDAWVKGGFSAASTCRSYGVSIDGNKPVKNGIAHRILRYSMRQAVPDSHMQFLRSLKFSHQVGYVYCVHAGVDPDKPLDGQSPVDQLWIRERFLTDERPFGAVVIHGHTIMPQPDVKLNRIGIDTGAFCNGVLTAAVVEGETLRFIHISD